MITVGKAAKRILVVVEPDNIHRQVRQSGQVRMELVDSI
jgi:hypothetical protein